MSKIRTVRANWPKYLLQWGTLLAIVCFIAFAGSDPEKYCPMGGLQAFVTFLTRGSLPCSMSSLQILMGLVLAAGVILFSKLFCAYLCPIGTVEDLLTKARMAIGIKGVEIKHKSIADYILRAVKYVLLFWIFYSTATASELFCKNLDPYYAVATGFKGEITLWMSLASLGLVLLLGFFIKRFWCRYICPLGALSNSLKFWIPLLVMGLLFWLLSLAGINIGWPWFLGAFCIVGYVLEAFATEVKVQPVAVIVDQDRCGRRCMSCQKACPYHINIPAYGTRMTAVDCMLCGECVAACPSKSLHIGSCSKKKCKAWKYLPAVLAVALAVLGAALGSRIELPTINETFGIEDGMELKTMKVEGLKSVKCYGSSMAFKARMEKVPGVHGVKTYVGNHSVVLSYDPAVTSEEKIMEQIFVPAHFRIWTPDPKKLSEIKRVTIRTEKMYDKMDLNYLGLQMRNTGKSVFGLESEYACPLIVHVYMSPDENLDEKWFKEIVEKKMLSMPVHGGGTKDTPVDFKFVRMEKEESFLPIDEYLEKMFDGFNAEFKGRYPQADSTVVRKRTEVYASSPQYIYEIADQNYEKPIIRRALPFLSNHLSKEEGVISVALALNSELVPSIQVRYAAPMTAEKLWELMTMEKWTITYKSDDVREEDARLKFKSPGTSYRYEEK
ncbi:MAG: 4Fe-4S binding protein [Candidatus Cryptobacteroides sp.]